MRSFDAAAGQDASYDVSSVHVVSSVPINHRPTSVILLAIKMAHQLYVAELYLTARRLIDPKAFVGLVLFINPP